MQSGVLLASSELLANAPPANQKTNMGLMVFAGGGNFLSDIGTQVTASEIMSEAEVGG
jgi:hypothetical protein